MSEDEFKENAQEAAGSEQEPGSRADTVSGADTDTEAVYAAADNADGDMLAWATDMVRERPMLALLGAAATGYALAFLFHGGRR